MIKNFAQQISELFIILKLMDWSVMECFFFSINQVFWRNQTTNTCVHVENCKAECGGEVPDERENHDGPVWRIFITLYEEGEEEHDPGGDGAAHVGIFPPNL